MQDMLGRDLKEDDHVLFIDKGFRGSVTWLAGTIVKFTKARVTIIATGLKETSKPKVVTTTRAPESLIKQTVLPLRVRELLAEELKKMDIDNG